MNDGKTHALLSNRTYNIFKLAATLGFPALGALYLAVSSAWGLGFEKEIATTIAAVNTFLGVVVFIAAKAYNNSEEKFDGVIEVSEDENGFKTASLVLKNYEDPASVVAQDQALFKVQQTSV